MWADDTGAAKTRFRTPFLWYCLDANRVADDGLCLLHAPSESKARKCPLCYARGIGLDQSDQSVSACYAGPTTSHYMHRRRFQRNCTHVWWQPFSETRPILELLDSSLLPRYSSPTSFNADLRSRKGTLPHYRSQRHAWVQYPPWNARKTHSRRDPDVLEQMHLS